MERKWKVPVVNYFNVPSRGFIEVSEQKYENFSFRTTSMRTEN